MIRGATVLGVIVLPACQIVGGIDERRFSQGTERVDSGVDASGDAAPGPRDSATHVPVEGWVTDFQIGTTGGNTFVEGVRVCLRDHPEVDCVVTPDDGTFRLEGAPAHADLVLTFEKEGFAPVANPFVTDGERGWVTAPLPGSALVDLFLGASGFPDALVEGGLIAFATFPALVGVSVEVDPMPTSGPVYTDESGVPDQSLTETTASNLGGVAVDPGVYALTYDHPLFSCDEFTLGWRPAGEETLRAPVYEGFITGVSASCR